MKRSLAILILVFACPAFAEVTLLPENKIASLFPGENRLTLTWTNSGAESVDLSVEGRVFQTSSALGLELPIIVKERLRLLPKQAAFWSVTVVLPELRAKTALVIRWQDEAENFLGKTDVALYPRNLLHELETLAGDRPLGIYSADEEFRRAFENGKAKFETISDDQARGFEGRLLILDGFPAGEATLKETLIPAARRGVTIICIVRDEKTGETLRPNFYAIPQGAGILVFVQGAFLEKFATNPEAQMRLIEICRMALKPGRPELPIIFPRGSS